MAPFGRRMGRMPRYLVALTFGLPAMHGSWFSANMRHRLLSFDTSNSCTKLKMVKKIQFEQFSLKLRFLELSEVYGTLEAPPAYHFILHVVEST